MEVFVRGSRSDGRDWLAAQRVSLADLPPLDERQRAEARRGGLSEESYARTVFAEHLTGQRLLKRLLRFGNWLGGKVEERNPRVRIEKAGLDTLRGRIEVELSEYGEMVDFEIDEDLVEKYLTTGSLEAETAIFRLLDIYVPRQEVARAS